MGRGKQIATLWATVAVAIVVGVLAAPSAQAALHVYESFDYATGALAGSSGGTGMSGSWADGPEGSGMAWVYDESAATTPVDTGAGTVNWDGLINIPTLPESGARYIGLNVGGGDKWEAYRSLSQDADTMAGGDNILWMSMAWHALGFGTGQHISLALATDCFKDRGKQLDTSGSYGSGAGDGIGVAEYAINSGDYAATVFDGGTPAAATNFIINQGNGDKIMVVKLEFGATDTVSVYAFSDGDTLSEVNFNANAIATNGTVDETALDILTFSNVRGGPAFDEIRIGDTFDDVIALSEAGETDPFKSSVVAVPDTVPADGSTPATITVTLLDGFGTALAGKSVSLGGSTGNAIITPVNPTTDVNGDATFTVVSGTGEIETFTATNTTDAVAVGPVNVAFQGGTDALVSTVTASRDIVLADGASTATITVTLKDSSEVVREGNGVTLVGSMGTATINPVGVQTSDANGRVAFEVSCGVAETEIFTATDTTDSVVVSQTVSVVFAAEDREALLVYEPFDYAVGTLTGENGGTGFSAAWSQRVGSSAPAVWGAADTPVVTGDGTLSWDGVITNIPTSVVTGEPRFVGMAAANSRVEMYRTLTDSAGTMAGGDAILWMSAVCRLEDKGPGSGVSLGLGDGHLGDRGNSFSGDTFIGSSARIANGWISGKLGALIATNEWYSMPNSPARYSYTSGAALSGSDFVLVFKFTFSGIEDTVETYAFPEASVLSEATFDANKKTATFPDGFDEDACTVLSFAQAFGENAIDEIRIGNAFNDVVGIPAPPMGTVLVIQ